MKKETIAFINPSREKKTLKEILDKAFESSNLDYEVSKQNNKEEDNSEEKVTEAIKNTPKLEVELKNVDYYA
ncbi:MAG: hypothetical protein HFJ41_01325 [Clostridia bacterium]|nr:hypothetical protein [Clostridia bacterium]